MVRITCFLHDSSTFYLSLVRGLRAQSQIIKQVKAAVSLDCFLPQHDSSHSRAYTRACHWPSRIFPLLGCCHSQSNRSVSDANFGFLPGYTHCWISAGKKIKIRWIIYFCYILIKLGSLYNEGITSTNISTYIHVWK